MATTKVNIEKNTFTRECLFMALRKLIAQKPISKISISEISDLAGVSRTTFYRNYDTVRDILVDYLEKHPFGAISAESYTPEKFDLIGRLRDSFESLYDEKDILYGIIASGEDRLLYENYDKLIKTVCRERAHDIGFRTEYEVSAFVGMYYAICYDWIRGGMKESIDDMVEISYRIIHTFYKNDEFAVPERDNVYLPVPPAQ